MSDIATSDKDEAEEVTAQLINKLFQRLRCLLPAFNQAWPTQEILDGAKREWMRTFMDNGINTAEKIQCGFDNLRTRTSPFAPTVGEFITLCVPKPAKLGVPTHAAAYSEAVRRSYPGGSDEKWSHAVVYHTWYETGSRALNMATGSFQIKEIKDLFYANYDITLKMFAEGGKLRELPKLLNRPDFKTEITQSGKDALNNLKKMAGANE